MRTDTEAIATWERAEHAPETTDHCAAYVCVSCDWTARGGVKATAHHTATGHDVRGRNWPESWGNAVFSAPRPTIQDALRRSRAIGTSVDPWLVERGTQ